MGGETANILLLEDRLDGLAKPRGLSTETLKLIWRRAVTFRRA